MLVKRTNKSHETKWTTLTSKMIHFFTSINLISLLLIFNNTSIYVPTLSIPTLLSIVMFRICLYILVIKLSLKLHFEWISINKRSFYWSIFMCFCLWPILMRMKKKLKEISKLFLDQKRIFVHWWGNVMKFSINLFLFEV